MRLRSVVKTASLIGIVLFLMTDSAFATVKQHSQEYGQPIERQAGEYLVALSATPLPISIGRNAISIEIKNRRGEYVTDADVAVTYQKEPMVGPAIYTRPWSAKTNLQGNTYRGSLTLGMDGDWDLKMQITEAGKITKLYQNMYVLENTIQ